MGERTIERVMTGNKREEKAGRVIEERRERYIVFRDPFYLQSARTDVMKCDHPGCEPIASEASPAPNRTTDRLLTN